MDIRIAHYKGEPIRYMEVGANGLLLNTKDVCRVLAITVRPSGSILAEPTLDFASAVRTALPNDDFAEWLVERFGQYDNETLVRPPLDDDWNSTSPRS